MTQYSKDVKKLQLQHLAEKAGIKEQFEFIYKKYKEKKEEMKKVLKQADGAQKLYEKEKRYRENQRKIYEKMFSEGLNVEDARNVMEKYIERENLKDLQNSQKKSSTFSGLNT